MKREDLGLGVAVRFRVRVRVKVRVRARLGPARAEAYTDKFLKMDFLKFQ